MSGPPGGRSPWDDVLHSALPGGTSLVGDAGADVPAEGPEHPFRVADDQRYEEGVLLGWGGMGQVLASRDRRLNREVAYKRVVVSAGGTAATARLAREAWITAHLEHPGIVPVYDAGFSPDGHIFYAMRLVRGRTLGVALAEAAELPGRLSLLRHVLDACEAVAYAHAIGVVHRDLKPANIMVGEFGETQVVDWGLAAVPDPLDAEAWRRLGLPGGPGEQVAAEEGTPSYMSPEQAKGGVVGPATDVWALGAVLYELLTGQPPYPGQDREAVLARARAGRVDPVADHAPAAPVELAAITERALRADPESRYASAGELARELARYFEGRHVEAYDYSPLELLWRFAHTWRAPLGVAAVAAIALLALGGWALDSTRQERNKALDALARADDALAGALTEEAWIAAEAGARAEAEVLASASLRLRPSVEARGVLAAFAAQSRPVRIQQVLGLPDCEVARLDARATLYACAVGDQISLWDITEASARRVWAVQVREARDLFLMPQAGTLAVSDVHRSLHWLGLGDGTSLAPATALQTEGPWFPIDGGTVSLGGVGGAWLMVVDGATRTTVRSTPCQGEGSIGGAALDQEGQMVVLVCGSGLVLEGPVAGPYVPVRRVPLTGSTLASAAALVPGGDVAIVGSYRGHVGQIALRDDAQDVPLVTLPGGRVRSLVPSPDGRRVAVVSQRGGVHVWSVDTASWLGRLPARTSRSATWRSGDQLVTEGDGVLEVWQLPPRVEVAALDFPVGLSHAAPAPDGRTVAVARSDGIIELRDAVTGARLLRDPDLPVAQGNPVCKRAAWSPSGDRLVATCGIDAWVRAYTTSDWQRSELPIAAPSKRVGTLVDGVVWALPYGPTGPVVLQGDEVWPPLVEGSFLDAESDSAGTVAAFLRVDGGVYLLRAGQRGVQRVLTDPRAGGVAVSDGAASVAVITVSDVALYEGDGTLRLRIDHPDEAVDVALSPDGGLVATGGRDGVVRVFDARTGEPRVVLRGHTERLGSVVFDRQGREILSSSWDGTVRRWGLDVLDLTPEAAATQAQEAWGLSVEEALSAPVR